MSMVTLELVPRDLLFLRDGRPMDVDKGESYYRNVGHGANWPRPDHLYNALMHALVGRMEGEREYGRHGDLRTVGPFPMRAGEVYFPRPLDWKMKPVQFDSFGMTDLPDYLTHGFLDCDQTKKTYPDWLSLKEYVGYLSGICVEFDEKYPRELYFTECRTGNTLDDECGASAKTNGSLSGRYSAEYLRLAEGVTMWSAADIGCDSNTVPQRIVMGGQGGVLSVLPNHPPRLSEMFPMPKAIGNGEKFVRWTLLTPAYYPETGWLPSFCKDSRKNVLACDHEPIGTVLLKDVVGVSLIGACTGKPIAVSGFDTLTGVKPTRLVVPAGSVYLFRCVDAVSANALIDKLHLQARSQNNNAGFGVGVCSLVSSNGILGN